MENNVAPEDRTLVTTQSGDSAVSIAIDATVAGTPSAKAFGTGDLLLALVENTKHPVLFISGDVHWAELSRMQGGEHDHVELTSSGLTEEWKKISPNKHRIGEAHAVSNFGLVDISFPNGKPVVNLTVKDSKGQTLIQSQF